MSDPFSEEEGVLREWAPLTGLLQLIPLKAQRGLFTQELRLTCIDAIAEFIAVGTSLGLVYWYNRKKGDLQRLRCEQSISPITCVRIISSVDYMVAAGNDNGIITVFQIPKEPPDNLPESMKPKKNKQVERYTISGLHHSAVTAAEWSSNGMKLFSGDKNGLVVLTEIDFYMHLSKSVELLNEKYEIVQLSYCQQFVLVSTTYRSIVCHRDDRWRVAQVGQKERKSLGKLGATFCAGSGRPQDLMVYASRPGLRLWQADKSGVVKQTLIYKDTMMKEHRHVQLVNPVPSHVKKQRGDHTFGPLLLFKDNLLVTYSSDMVYVLEPNDIYVVATVADLRRVQDVCVTKDEIFILEGDRSIIRVAYVPEVEVHPPVHEIVSEVANEPSTCTLTPNEVFLHIVGSPEIQQMLSDKNTTKEPVWSCVANEMTRLGYSLGEQGAVKCLQKWNYMVANYNLYKETNKWNNQAQCPAYFDFLEQVLNQSPQEEQIEEETENIIEDCPLIAKEEPDEEEEDENENEEEIEDEDEPKRKKVKINPVQACDSYSLLGTPCNFIEESEMLETEVVDGCNSVYVDMLQDENETVFYDDEHITVYPETNSQPDNEDIAFPMADNENVYIVVTPSFADQSQPVYIAEADEAETKVILNSTYDYNDDISESQIVNIQLNTEAETIADDDHKEIIVSSKGKEPLRPVPTPAQALMALVSRIGRSEKDRDERRRRKYEKIFDDIEETILRQNVEIQSVAERAALLLSELLTEDSSESE